LRIGRWSGFKCAKDLADELESGGGGGDCSGVRAGQKEVLEFADKPVEPVTYLCSFDKTLNKKQGLIQLMRENFILIDNGMESLIKSKQSLEGSRIRLVIREMSTIKKIEEVEEDEFSVSLCMRCWA
jgi:hypothetical protein